MESDEVTKEINITNPNPQQESMESLGEQYSRYRENELTDTFDIPVIEEVSAIVRQPISKPITSAGGEFPWALARKSRYVSVIGVEPCPQWA